MNTKKTSEKNSFVFEKINYQLMLIGLVAIIIGFILMSGGKSDDPTVFNEQMFNARRIIIAPLLVLGGFVFEIYAIMKKPKN